MLEMLQQFHFLRPWWWLALPMVLLGVWALARTQRQGDRWTSLIAPELLPYLIDGKHARQRRNLAGWLALPLAVVICALAGPVWQQLPQAVERNTAAVVICWDLSPSMLAQDVTPSRLDRSRLKIIDLLKSRKDGLTGLIAYSGEAYVVAPLTEDVETIINLLPSLGPTTLPSVGSNPEMAMQEAMKLMQASGIAKGDLLFLTDGIDPKAFDNLQDQLGKNQHRLSIWGIGGKAGAPIPLPRGGFLKEGGNTVLAKINDDEMRQFASANQGYYLPLQANDADIKTLNRIFEHKDQHQQQANRQFDQWFEAGQYLVLLVLPLVLILFRRGWLLAALVFVPFMSSPTPAQASLWQDFWQTRDQQGAKLMQQGDAKTAADTFDNPSWKGTAQFQSQNYDAAAQTFKQQGDADSLYNAGNAYVKANRFDDAIKAYDEALAKNPQLTDAANNKKIAQQLKELAKQQKQQNPGGDQDKKDGQQQSSDKSGSGDQKADQDSGKQDDAQQNPSKNDTEKQNQGDPQKNSPQESGQDPSGDSKSANTPSDTGQTDNNNKQDADPKDDSHNNPTAQQDAEAKAKREAAAQQQAEQADQEKNEKAEAAEAAGDDQKPEGKPGAVANVDKPSQTEEQQKMEQWLKRVPDDPSGLMRNKFKYQYQLRRQNPQAPADANNNPEQRW